MTPAQKFFVDHGTRQVAELSLTVDELYALFKERLQQEEQEDLAKAWPTLGTQP